MYHISYSRECYGNTGQAILVDADTASEAEEKLLADMPDARICGGARLATADDMKPGKPVIENDGRLTFVGRR